ncbi:chloride channel protein CLC-e-like [Papaver somniferum]|uniref:chloride channel protein CLC-e-like n=1 Tax=Papaver somniferum TaxID=3469 RepID=UPI000E6FAFCE|nr:chloride channel protein CLC-e-like [Papaver somniferum]
MDTSSSCICCKLCNLPKLRAHHSNNYAVSSTQLNFLYSRNHKFTNKFFNSLKFHHREKPITFLKPLKVKSTDSTEPDNFAQVLNVDKKWIAEEEEEVGNPLQGKRDKERLDIIAACIIGLCTGVGVVLFNYTVHELRDILWDGFPSRGATWLRQQPIEDRWVRVILVPTGGGVLVAILNSLRSYLRVPSKSQGRLLSNVKASCRPVLKAFAASITLGSGNALGPEGPSVEIGASIAKGISSVFGMSNQRRTSLVAAGSAAGIASGFNAAIAGCFFAVESVLWPSPAADSSPSLTNTTSMVILSAVIAAIISEVGLGSEPAFKVPEYDFRSPSELPLYLLLGILCGLVSLTLSRCTSYAITAVEKSQKVTGIPKVVFPVIGGLSVGVIALAYPEILYWGFENVDLLLESNPYVKGLPADLLLQLIGVKIITTSFCRASGLVGGYYAPSLFIGAATGMAYGKLVEQAVFLSDPIFHLSILEVASPQAYGLVGMAATLAGVCQVPLTAVLLLFQLTQDYRIVLPLLGAVGCSSWIASGQVIKRETGNKRVSLESKRNVMQNTSQSPFNSVELSSNSSSDRKPSNEGDELCELESSLCLDDSGTELKAIEERITVSQAMRIRYVTVSMSTFLMEAVTLMLEERQSCAMIVDNENFVIGFLTLDDIQEFSTFSKPRRGQDEVQNLTVSEMCNLKEGKCRVLWTATPDMNLLSVESVMDTLCINQLPVVIKHVEGYKGYPVGLIDKECIDLACRIAATRESLGLSSALEKN